MLDGIRARDERRRDVSPNVLPVREREGLEKTSLAELLPNRLSSVAAQGEHFLAALD